MTVKSPGRLRIPQWSIVNRLVTAYDITLDENGVETSRSRTDLTGGYVYFTVRDEYDNIVIQKSSWDTAEIEHLTQSGTTIGQARIKFVEADTGALTIGGEYYFDVWVQTSDGREEPIVDRGKFYVDKSVTYIPGGPAPTIPSYPAPQTAQERSFLHTWSETGTSDAVTIPGGGAMVDANYIVIAMVKDGSPVSFTAASGSQTDTGFVLQASGPLNINDTVGIILRDA